MPRFSADQIYQFAREAGFSPDRAATMTAIALAESGGNSGSLNNRGEYSIGLWQINHAAHKNFDSNALYDPVQNAKAAFQVSKGGDDISPWTTAHNKGGGPARYLQYKEQAQQAAINAGDGPGRGMWSGVRGYGDHQSAGDERGGGAPPNQSSSATSASSSDNVNVQNAASTNTTGAGQQKVAGQEFGIPLFDQPAGGAQVQGLTATGAAGQQASTGQEYGIPLFDDNAPAATAQPAQAANVNMNMGQQQQQPLVPGNQSKLQKFLDSAVAQTGDKYVFGHEVKVNDPNPSTFDCSELVEWAAGQAGVKVTDGSWLQYQNLAKSGTTMSVEQALKTPGALLFSFGSDPMKGGRPTTAHVAISLGNGQTIEAKGTQYGVGSWPAKGRFQYAGYIPEFGAGNTPVTPMPAQQQPQAHVDGFAARVNSDPAPMDRNPSTVKASHTLTQADPSPVQQAPAPAPAPPQPEPPQPEPPVVEQKVTMGDVNNDSQDDGMHDAQGWHAPEDHSLPTHQDDQHDFNDHTPGH